VKLDPLVIRVDQQRIVLHELVLAQRILKNFVKVTVPFVWFIFIHDILHVRVFSHLWTISLIETQLIGANALQLGAFCHLCEDRGYVLQHDGAVECYLYPGMHFHSL